MDSNAAFSEDYCIITRSIDGIRGDLLILLTLKISKVLVIAVQNMEEMVDKGLLLKQHLHVP